MGKLLEGYNLSHKCLGARSFLGLRDEGSSDIETPGFSPWGNSLLRMQ